MTTPNATEVDDSIRYQDAEDAARLVLRQLSLSVEDARREHEDAIAALNAAIVAARKEHAWEIPCLDRSIVETLSEYSGWGNDVVSVLSQDQS